MTERKPGDIIHLRLYGDMIWSHELEDGSGTPATAFGKYLVNINGRGLQIRQASDGEVLQELTGLRLDDYNRVVVVDGMIMALS